MALLENVMNCKEYLFLISSSWETLDNDARLIKRTKVDTKVMIRNMGSFIMTFSEEAKQ